MGPKPQVIIRWSPHFAYAIGLLTTDGNLSPDKRHLSLTSKDREQLENFLHALNIKVKIGVTLSGLRKKYLRIQFGDVTFYKFLLTLGLTPNKSKTLGSLTIPKKYFFDFLRGHFDGDGSFYSYWDPRWRSSFMFYTMFISASKEHIEWLRTSILQFLNIKGHVTKGKNHVTYHLKYAKQDSLKLLRKMYYSQSVMCLTRKKLKIQKALGIVGLQL